MFEKLPKSISELIKKEVNSIRQEYAIENMVIRNDIFEVLKRMCTVLFYPLEEGEDANGIHVERWVKNRLKHFVFINSNNPLEKQVYTAAHEMGHILKIDVKVKEKIAKKADSEAIINRFAAELLMPEESFVKRLLLHCDELNIQSGEVEEDDILSLIVRLMDNFMVPYKAIVYRLEELDVIGKEDRIQLEEIEQKNNEHLLRLLKSENYVNLNQIKRQKSMGQLERLLYEAQQREVYSDKKIENIRKKFGISAPSSQKDGEDIMLVVPDTEV